LPVCLSICPLEFLNETYPAKTRETGLHNLNFMKMMRKWDENWAKMQRN